MIMLMIMRLMMMFMIMWMLCGDSADHNGVDGDHVHEDVGHLGDR